MSTSSNPKPTLIVFILWISSFIPFLSVAQQKKSNKPAKGYGEATYQFSENGQFMSTWLIAGPLKIETSGGNNPSEEVQKFFFQEPLPPVVVLAKKPVAPLQVNGKSYLWGLEKSTTAEINLDNKYAGADFVAAYAMAEIRCDK